MGMIRAALAQTEWLTEGLTEPCSYQSRIWQPVAHELSAITLSTHTEQFAAYIAGLLGYYTFGS